MTHNLRYQWHGILQSGETVSGIIEARTAIHAKTELRKQGIITRRIVKKRHFILNRYNQKINQKDITLFTRQLATLITAGIPLMRSFEIIESGLGHQKIKMLMNTLKQDVGSGLLLAQALQRHPAYFNALFCSMVDIGEHSGALDVMLDKLATHKEKIASIKKKILTALTYPTAVMLIGIMITCGLLIVVIPQFESLFTDFGAELPALTRFVIHASNFFVAWWVVIFSSALSVIGGCIHAHKHYPKFTELNHRISLNIPVIGYILQKAYIARFTRSLSITFAAGLPLTDALKSVANVTGNHVFTQAAFKIRQEISHGQSMQQAIKKTRLFPCMVMQMIAIGEESGTLEKMLLKIADFYEEDIDNAVDALGSILEPAIMTILGLLVGGLVVAMYLPILKLGTVI